MTKGELVAKIEQANNRYNPAGTELIFTKDDNAIKVEYQDISAYLPEYKEELDEFRFLSISGLIADGWRVMKFLREMSRALEMPIDDGSEGLTVKLAGETQLKEKLKIEKAGEAGKVEALTMVVDKLLNKIS